MNIIPQALKKGKITPSTRDSNKFDVWFRDYQLVIQSEWSGNKINWVVTSFEQDREYLQDIKNSPRVVKTAATDDLTGERPSSPNEDYTESLSQSSSTSNTHAEITGPALQKRGEGWGSEQWSESDYSVQTGGCDYATATGAAPTVQNAADEKRALTRISDIMNKLRKIRPVRQGVDAPKSVLGYTDQQKQIARHRWAGDWKTAAHEIGHIVDYKLGLRDKVANSAQLAAMQQELEALGVHTSPPNSTAE